MNICLNYYGLPRNSEITKFTFNKHIHTNDNNINYYVLYTTWENENVDEFKKIFPNSYINFIEKPDIQKYNYIINNYNLDPGNPHKTIDHYVLGMYIKKMSYTTITNFEKNNNINFDFIITIRPDIYLNNHLSNFYDFINTNLKNKDLNNTVYVANTPKFDVYGQPALPDVMFISDKDTSKKILEQLDILVNCTLKDTNIFHPESSFYNAITFLKINIHELNLFAFPSMPW